MSHSSNPVRDRTIPHGLESLTFVYAFAVAWFGRQVPLNAYPDSYWHRKAGEWMLEQLTLPKADPWSFTAGSLEWINLSWGFDLLLASGHHLLGAGGMAFLLALMMGLAVASVTGVLLRRGYGVLPIFAVMFWLPALLLNSWVWRPQLVTILFTFFWMWCLFYRDWRWQRMLLLACIYLAWVNMHGGFLMAWVLMAVAAYSVFRKRPFVRLHLFILLVGLCLVFTFISPWEWRIFEGIWRTMGSPAKVIILEWKSLWNANPPSYSFLAFVTCVALVMCLGRKRVRLEEAILVAFSTAMAMLTVRHVSVMIALTVLPMVRAMVESMSYVGFLRRKDREYTEDFGSLRGRCVVAGLAAVGCAMMMPAVFRDMGRMQQDVPHESIRPTQAFEYLATVPEKTKVWNEYGYGATIVFEFDGRLQPAIDGRVDTAYPRSLVKDYVQFYLRQSDWTQLPKHYGVDLILLAPDTEHEAGLKEAGWQRVDEVEDALLMVPEDAEEGVAP